jgi:hypothetical protein
LRPSNPRRLAALVAVASCAAIPAAAATGAPTSTWAINGGGISGDSDRASAAAPLPDGGTLSTGYYYRTATFGSHSVTVAGSYDVFVAKAAPGGTWEWVATAGGTGGEESYGLTSFSDGTALVTGIFSGTIRFGNSISLTSVGGNDAFVAKLNADGTWAWATPAGGAGSDVGLGVAGLAGGGAIVTGTFSGTATFGTTSLASAGSEDAFVAKLSAGGTWAWATRAGGGTGNDTLTHASTLADGSAIVVGTFNTAATFPGAGTVNAVGGAGNDVVVAKVNADGTWAWATPAGGAADDKGSGVAVLPDGSALVSAWMSSANPMVGSVSLTGLGNWDAVVGKISSSGTWVWAANGGGSADDRALDVTAFADGSALITGPFNGTATFGLNSVTSAGGQDAYAAALTPSGNWDWVVRGGGASNDSSFGLAAFPDGSAAVVGQFSSTGPSFGGLPALTKRGSGDAFTWRMTGAGATGTTSNGPADLNPAPGGGLPGGGGAPGGGGDTPAPGAPAANTPDAAPKSQSGAPVCTAAKPKLTRGGTASRASILRALCMTGASAPKVTVSRTSARVCRVTATGAVRGTRKGVCKVTVTTAGTPHTLGFTVR